MVDSHIRLHDDDDDDDDAVQTMTSTVLDVTHYVTQ